jgi:hypothetical protein
MYLLRIEISKTVITHAPPAARAPSRSNRNPDPDAAVRAWPVQSGSPQCVRLDSEFYAFTAARVIRDAGS